MFSISGEKILNTDIATLYAELTDLNKFVPNLPDLKLIKEVKENEAHVIIAPGFSFLKTELDTIITCVPNGTDGSQITIASKGIGTFSKAEASFNLKPSENSVIVNWEMKTTELGGLLKLVPPTLLKAAANQVIGGLLKNLEEKLTKDHKMQTITEAEFNQKVLESTEPILVDFYSPTCPPCRMLDSKTFPQVPDLNIVKIDATEAINLSTQYRVNAVPTLIVFKGGKEVKRQLGYVEPDVLRKMFE